MRAFRHVDIIIPAYNSEHTISSCLKSICELEIQDININVLVVDNNSTDQTSSIAEALGFNVIKCPRQGRSFARNAGLRHTHSPYVAFIDSDVTLEKDWLLKLLPILKNPCVAAVQSRVIPHAATSFVDSFIYAYKEQSTNGTFIEMESLDTFNPLIDTAACLYSRSALEQVNGFNEELRYLEDQDISIRLSAQGFSLRANPEVSAYKVSNRTIVTFLLRTMHDAQDMYKYMDMHVGKISAREMIRILTSSGRKKKQWKKISFKLLNKSNNMFWEIGFIQSYIRCLFQPLKRREIKHKLAKMNLLLKQVKIDHSENKYIFSSSRRFYFSGKTLIIYGPKEETLKRYQDDEMLSFFADYLDNPNCDFFKHNGAIQRAIADQLFQPL